MEKKELCQIRVTRTDGLKLHVKTGFPWLSKLGRPGSSPAVSGTLAGVPIMGPLQAIDGVQIEAGARELRRDRPNLAVLFAEGVENGVAFNLPPMTNGAAQDLCKQYRDAVAELYQEHLRPLNCSHTLTYVAEGELV